MLNYRLTADAQSDLINIRNYTLERWGRQQSQKYLTEIRQTIRLLSETPAIGKQRPDVALDIFSFQYVSHVIYFTLRERQLIVFGVLHKSMVPGNHLGEREII